MATGDTKRPKSFWRRLLARLREEPLAIVTALGGAVWAMFNFVVKENEHRVERSIAEVNRIYAPAFMDSLSTLLGDTYDFLDQTQVDGHIGAAQYEAYWAMVSKRGHDEDMMIVKSRLDGVAACVDHEGCDPSAVNARFPRPVYQAVYFLRDFLLPAHLESQGVGLEGWLVDADVVAFLNGYARYSRTVETCLEPWTYDYPALNAVAHAKLMDVTCDARRAAAAPD